VISDHYCLSSHDLTGVHTRLLLIYFMALLSAPPCEQQLAARSPNPSPSQLSLLSSAESKTSTGASAVLIYAAGKQNQVRVIPLVD